MERKLRLAGQILDAAGKFRHIEIAGPPTLEVWEEAFDVMQTAFIMLDILDLGTMTLYRKKIVDYHNQYGPSTWLLLYQTDVRFRHEKVEKVKRELVRAHALAVTAAGTTPYDDNRPWNYTYVKGMADKEWWDKQFRDPAMLYLNKLAQLQACLLYTSPSPRDS